jgi:hypothetical protein
LAYSIAYLRSSFGWLLESKKTFRNPGTSSARIYVHNEKCKRKLSVVKGEAGESVSTKLHAVLKRNPGISAFASVRYVRNGDDADPPKDIAPAKISLFKCAPVTSCDVERFFLAYKHILSDKRQSP